MKTVFDKILAGVASVALVSFALGAGPARADSLVRVGKAFPGVFDFVPVDIGVAKGIFKKHGVAVKIASFGGSAKLQQGLAANAVDIGLGSGVELAFVARGAPVKAVAEFMGPPADLTLFVRNEPDLKTVADLKGKHISCSTVSSLTEWMIHRVSIHEGWGTHGIVTVPLGKRGAQVAMMRTKHTDGMAIDFVGGTMLQRKGLGHILLHFDSVVPNFITHAMYARKAFIKDHPAALRGFLAGWFDTIAYMRAHKADTVRLAAKAMRSPPDIVAADYDVVMKAFSDTGHFEPKGLAVLRNSFVEMKLLKSKPDMSKLYTEKFLPHPAG